MSTHFEMLPFACKCCSLLALIGAGTPSRAQYNQPVEAPSAILKAAKVSVATLAIPDHFLQISMLHYEYINNPGYNRDRGPASLLTLRLHAEF